MPLPDNLKFKRTGSPDNEAAQINRTFEALYDVVQGSSVSGGGGSVLWGQIGGDLLDQLDIVNYVNTRGFETTAVWGGITGTLSDQDDLQSELDGKQDDNVLLGFISNLTNPGADRIMFWDNSAGNILWLEAGSGLTITGTTIEATGSGPTYVGISSNTTLVLANVVHGTVYSNTTSSNYTINLPTPTAADLGKQFYVATSATYAGQLTLQHSGGTNVLLKDETSTNGPHVITHGTALVTVVQGAFSSYYYSISGWWT